MPRELQNLGLWGYRACVDKLDVHAVLTKAVSDLHIDVIASG